MEVRGLLVLRALAALAQELVLLARLLLLNLALVLLLTWLLPGMQELLPLVRVGYSAARVRQQLALLPLPNLVLLLPPTWLLRGIPALRQLPLRLGARLRLALLLLALLVRSAPLLLLNLAARLLPIWRRRATPALLLLAC